MIPGGPGTPGNPGKPGIPDSPGIPGIPGTPVGRPECEEAAPAPTFPIAGDPKAGKGGHSGGREASGPPAEVSGAGGWDTAKPVLGRAASGVDPAAPEAERGGRGGAVMLTF